MIDAGVITWALGALLSVGGGAFALNWRQASGARRTAEKAATEALVLGTELRALRHSVEETKAATLRLDAKLDRLIASGAAGRPGRPW